MKLQDPTEENTMPLPPDVVKETDHIIADAVNTMKRTGRGASTWFWIYTVVQWAAPILTAFLSVLIGAAANSQNTPDRATARALGVYISPAFVLTISVLATILTTIISVVSPEKRFVRVAIVDNRLQWFVSVVRLEKAALEEKYNVGSPPPAKEAIDWAKKKRTDLTQLLDWWQSGVDLPSLV